MTEASLSALADLSYDRQSNLKEAIDWILRVTGKDGGEGGSGSGNETILAKAITELPDFNDAIKAAAEKLGDRGNVPPALVKLNNAGTLKNIIEQLADGLKTFIGYGGGQGIAMVIDPLQQLRKGVLMFLYSFLGRLNSLNLNEVRMGKEGVSFETAMHKVTQISQSGSSINNIPDVVAALKKVDDLISHKDGHTFSGVVSKYLKGVLNAVKAQVPGKIDILCTHFPTLITAYGNKSSDLDTKYSQVQQANETLRTVPGQQPAKALVSAVASGTPYLLKQLKADGYKSSYQGHNWNGITTTDKIAQIFLGCLPLYYYWLTHLYWKCSLSHSQGGWNTLTLSRAAFRNFIVSMGYNAMVLNTRTKGEQIVTAFSNFKTEFSSVKPHQSHTEFFASLDPWSKSVSDAKTHPLTTLFLGASIYFTSQQSKRNATSKPTPPTSIREMLYWLCGLQFSPYYSDLKKQIEKHIPDNGLPVADSAMNTSNNMITRDQMKGFLLSSCLSAPGLLGAIQGNAADSKEREGEPWLYSLFCNTMNLQYPSGSALFNTLANYTYALQFQLYFLYIQCRTNYSQTYGWQWCRYGQSALPNGKKSEELASWICKGSNCKDLSRCQHNSDKCQHIKECGTQGKASPLQAFLTDNLQGFHVAHQSATLSPHHLDNHPPGSMCHVPMGFASALTTDTNATGWNIYYLLEHFCSGPKTPLRQLCEKLSSLTKRTPRTLGDLFGFMWHLNGQLFNKAEIMQSLNAAHNQKANDIESTISKLKAVWKMRPSLSSPEKSGVVQSLEAMAPSIPFLYQLFMMDESKFLPITFFNLRQQCHRYKGGRNIALEHKDPAGVPCSHSDSNSPADLHSLYQPVGPKPRTSGGTDPYEACRNGGCGPYLYPLTHTDGATYVPVLASAYLSWFLYLSDDFEAGLRDMLERFKGLECTKCKNSCHSDSTGSASCSCPSIVECSGVLPLLYSNGFSFGNAYSLKGGTQGTDPMKRNCQKFHSQLTAVLAQNESAPLFKLLLTIDDFLYMFRFYFFYNLSSFWILYVCIVLYIYLLRADLLHIRSHVHFPSSHGIPSIGLLSTGKPTVLTKLSNLAYLMP
ncbi:variant erythrocyte surface antigen-1 family protein [Babesia caballi]|uniref:Variant erythrocyte surface antigen-1 family protein n=1 Tax=Babesia caballi TaxID=5871 RepID=A0AAV4LPV3_BABCB|nr:variant erythrocyte surface antigen-1 family protein [Babesia caballi]